MKIKNFGHCCLLIEENNVRILTDPGISSVGQEDVKNLNVILITHEHPDHIHIPSLKNCLVNNPNAEILQGWDAYAKWANSHGLSEHFKNQI